MPAAGRTALYRAFNADGDLLYVGITDSPADRFKMHQDTAEWWALTVVREIEWFDTRKAAQRAEARAIDTEKPKFNKQRYAPEHTPFWLPRDVAAYVPSERIRKAIWRRRAAVESARLRLEESVREGRAAKLSYDELAQLSGLSASQVRRVTSASGV